ncbi:MAG: hypothetical protein WAK17_21905 [Candidatus Nitrosopolaris sp.]
MKTQILDLVDPVCGMTIDENTPQFKVVNGNEVHLCCKAIFEESIKV